jgi:PAS domain S-box-containing protein
MDWQSKSGEPWLLPAWKINRRKLMKENTLFRHVDRDSLEYIPVIIALHDTQNNIVWANKLYREATGRSLSEIEGKKCYTVWGLEKPCRHCPVLSALETGEAAEGELTPDNQEHWPKSLGSWLPKAKPIRDKNENIIGALEVAIDITVRKQAEEKLKESETRYKRLFESASEAIYLIDSHEGKILDANLAAAEMIERDKEEILTLSINEVDPNFTHEEFLNFWKDLPFEKAIIFETEHKKKNGTLIPVEVSGTKFKIKDEILFFGLARDITERKKVEEELSHQRAMMVRTDSIAHVGSWEWDISNDHVTWSEELFRIFGLDPAEGAVDPGPEDGIVRPAGRQGQGRA